MRPARGFGFRCWGVQAFWDLRFRVLDLEALFSGILGISSSSSVGLEGLVSHPRLVQDLNPKPETEGFKVEKVSGARFSGVHGCIGV